MVLGKENKDYIETWVHGQVYYRVLHQTLNQIRNNVWVQVDNRNFQNNFVSFLDLCRFI